MTTSSGKFVGIDVAKDKLDIAILGEKKAGQVGIDEEGIAKLIKKLEMQEIELIAVEATGGYQRVVVLELYDFYTEKMEACDLEINRHYGLIRPDWGSMELPVVPEKKRHTHSKNAPKDARKIREHLYRINGVDLSLVDGMGISLAQTVTMEVGSNVGEKFPTEKHFCSWLGLAPKHDISGGKVLNNKTLKTKNRAGQAFRLAAQSVKKGDCPFGVLYRRL